MLFVLNVTAANGLRRRLVFVSLLALLAGGSIYLILRPGEFLFHRWMVAIGIDPGSYKGFVIQWKGSGALMEWVLYSLPDGLWAFAYAMLISGLWVGSQSQMRYVWYATIPLLILGYEGLQGLALMSGTFSLSDLLTCSAGGIFSICIVLFIHKKRGYETKKE